MDFHAKNSALKHKQTPEVLPASQYLQDRLLERRARHPRPKRSRQSDLGPRMAPGYDDDLFFAEAEEGKHSSTRPYDSSPLAPLSKYGSEVGNGSANASLSSGGRKRRTPGARELDEQMDRLNKQNFDLKLEIDHRRESQAKMQAEIESMHGTVDRAQRIAEEHEELMLINSRLVEELEKRDKAIQEAADIICELEEKIEEYEERRATETRPSTAHADSGYAGTETHEQLPPSSPPEAVVDSPAARQTPAAAAASNRLNSAVQTQTPARPRREPAFLTSQKDSTTALRSVYLDAGKDLHPVKSFNSILSRRTSGGFDDDALAEDVLNSPRLSALSESSFPSIYGKKVDTPEKFGWEDEMELPESERPFGSAHSRQDSITRVNQWIEDRQSMTDTPSKSNRISSPLLPATMIPSPQLRRKQTENSILSLSSAAASARSKLLETPASVRPVPVVASKQAPRTPTAQANAVFGDSMLPPTPESVSTQMLRPSHSNFASERSLLDTTPAHKLKTFAPLEPRSSANPKHMQTSPELHGEYNNSAQTNKFGYEQTAINQTAIDDDESETDEEYHDAMSDTVHDVDMDYDGFPDGNSITNGTPSRFFKYDKPSSAVTDMFFNASEVTPPNRGTQPQRRKSSAEVKITSLLAGKPDFHRADTSPTVFGSGPRRMDGRPATSGNTGSPRSFNNASSTIRLVNQDDHTRMKPRPSSPEPFPSIPESNTASSANTTRTTTPSPPKRPAAPASTTRSSFSQKTQNLFRRLSNTSTSDSTTTATDPPRRRERERSPLPTLTSTPASAYQMRRPSTSAANFGMTPIIRPGSRAASRDRSMAGSASRPGLSNRGMTEPSNVSPPGARPASTGPTEVVPGSSQRKGLFRRGGSFHSQGQQPKSQDGGSVRRGSAAAVKR
ncbi:hypothetical protein Q7P37_007772 [Cladosporium fusiforme]